MKIEHIAMWVDDLEKMKSFYVKYFNAHSNEIYHNSIKDYRSYFISFDEGCRLELMQMPGIKKSDRDETQSMGLIHFAISVGSKERVDELTEQLRKDGYKIIGEPRKTGDGYYESVVMDPEGNHIEITT